MEHTNRVAEAAPEQRKAAHEAISEERKERDLTMPALLKLWAWFKFRLDRAVQKKHLTLVSEEREKSWLGPGEEVVLTWRCAKTKETYVQHDSVYGGNRFNPCISFRCQSCSESFSGYEMDQPWVNPADLQAAIEGRWPRNEPRSVFVKQSGPIWRGE